MAQRISSEEYKRQSSEYTKAALAELNQQMNNTEGIRKRRNIRHHSEGDDYTEANIIELDGDENGDENSNNIHEPVNIAVTVGSKKKSVVKQQNIADATYLITINEKLEAHIFRLQNKIDKLTETVDTLESDIDELDKKYHYLKLDYSNKCLEYETLEKKYKMKCNECIVTTNILRQCIIVMIVIIIIMIFSWLY